MALLAARAESSQGSGYTATHYVEPFADVPGATHDEDDMGASAWSAAQNAGQATTLGTAMARATEGSRVQITPGVYVGDPSGDRFVASFYPTNSGTQGNEIVFFAQHPAAYNRGSPGLWSTIERPADESIGDLGPAIGMSTENTHDVILDGLHFDESVSVSGPAEGMIQLRLSCLRIQLRRLYIERKDQAPNYDAFAGGYNGNCIFASEANDIRIVDCYIDGTTDEVVSHNDGSIEFYNVDGAIVEHVTFNRCASGVFAKQESDPQTTIFRNIVVRYCNLLAARGHHFQTCRSMDLYDNLIRLNGVSGAGGGSWGVRWGTHAAYLSNERFGKRFSCYRNTVVSTRDNEALIYMQSNKVIDIPTAQTNPSAAQDLVDPDWHSNLVVQRGSATPPPGGGNLCILSADSSGWGSGDSGGGANSDVIAGQGLANMLRYDYNFYAADTSPRWLKFGSVAAATTIGDWQTLCAAEGQQPNGDDYEEHSQFGTVTFVDESGGDFRLAENGQAALTASPTGGEVGFDRDVEVGLRASPSY